MIEIIAPESKKEIAFMRFRSHTIVRLALLSALLAAVATFAPLPGAAQTPTFIQLSSGPIYPSPSLGPLVKGETAVPLKYRIVNNSDGTIVINPSDPNHQDSIMYVPACDSSVFANCTGAAIENNVLTNFSSGVGDASTPACTGMVFTFGSPVAGVIPITFAGAVTLTAAPDIGSQCIIDFTADVTGVPAHDVDNGFAGVQTFGTGFAMAHGTPNTLLNGSGTGSSEVTIDTCEVKLDKQISCDGGATWQDVTGFGAPGEGSATDTSTNTSTLGCVAKVGANIQERYVISNALATAAPVTCSALTDSTVTGNVSTNLTISAQSPGSPLVISNPNNPFACTNASSGNDTATLGGGVNANCTCTGLNGLSGTTQTVPVDSGSLLTDTATHLCADVTIDKQVSCNSGGAFSDLGQVRSNEDGTKSCTGPNTGNAFEAQWFAQNQGTVPLTCSLTDSDHAFLASPITNISLNPGNPSLIGGPTAPVACSAVTGNEPDTATLTCVPSAAILATGLVDRTGGLSVFDLASVGCQGVGKFTANKTCVPTSPGSTTFTSTVTVFNTDPSGATTLMCNVTDTTFAGSCASPGAATGTVTISPNPINVGASTQSCSPSGSGCTSAFGTGTLTATSPVCNEANISCTANGTQLATQLVTADCAAPGIKIKKVFVTNGTTIDQDSVAPGATVTVDFNISNTGSVPLNHIHFTDVFPPHLTSPDVSTPVHICGGTYTIAGNVLTFISGNLAVGASCTIPILLTADSTGFTPPIRVCDTTSTIAADGITSAPGAFACITIGTAPISPGDSFQIYYAANLDQGDSYVNLSNSGTSGTDPQGDICVNVYAFDPAEEMIACCTCLVTPNALMSLSVNNDLLINRLTPGPKPTSVVIKLLSSATDPGLCDPSTPNFQQLVPGMRAWGTTLHAQHGNTSPFATVEDPFEQTTLSAAELNHLSSFCGFILDNGSGFGVCNSCRTGALAGAKNSQ